MNLNIFKDFIPSASSVLLIYTGGTIGMKEDPNDGTLKPFDFSSLLDEVPELRKFGLRINSYTFDPIIDSSDVEPTLWVALAKLIKDKYDDYDGFVILHGTDTMAYSASALSFMFEHLTKPIIFTGSQLPVGRPRTDGKENIIAAVEIAAAKDSLSDCIATAAVVVSMVLQEIFGWYIDGWIGVIVSLIVLKAGFEVCRDTVDSLLGGKPDPEKIRRIKELMLSYDGILGVHDLVLHDYGPGRCMASVHAEVDSRCDIVEIHEVIDTAEREMGEALQLPICIHMDPVVSGDEKTEEAKEQMAAYLASLEPPLQLHDFRRVPGDKHINLIFDVLLPADVKKTETLLSGIQAHACTMDARYRCVVHFDRDYFGASHD